MTRSLFDPTAGNRRSLARVILASASPRRRDILKNAGVAFEVQPADIPEIPHAGEIPGAFVERMAREKALAVAASRTSTEPVQVLGADTIVLLDGTVLGKPEHARDAERQLARLVGREHRVLSGVAVVTTSGGAIRSRVVESRVRMRSATPDEIREYVAGGEPLDKAGSYALQGEGGRRFVTQVIGSQSNVIGLPLNETLELLHGPQAQAGGGAETGRGSLR